MTDALLNDAQVNETFIQPRRGYSCELCGGVLHNPLDGAVMCRARLALGLRDQVCPRCGDAYPCGRCQ